ncbi:hypothetical protein AB3662_28790 [Sorangium cellulosum]|uniref:hypothetical protein n=1 Tax=Sorangium cellulosum TaxID=56 RepID=UPI003D9A7553
MDANTLAISGMAILGAVTITGLWIFRHKVKVILRGGGTSLEFNGDNAKPAPPPGMQIGKAQAGRDLSALDTSGRGMHMGEANAGRDMKLEVGGGESPSQLPKG